eukprot:15219754-Alexandrium_andersonii.AAC.1
MPEQREGQAFGVRAETGGGVTDRSSARLPPILCAGSRSGFLALPSGRSAYLPSVAVWLGRAKPGSRAGSWKSDCPTQNKSSATVPLRA